MSGKQKQPHPIVFTEIELPPGIFPNQVYERVRALQGAILANLEQQRRLNPGKADQQEPVVPPHIFEQAVSIGQDITIAVDVLRMLYGWLASLVETAYGEANMKKFAQQTRRDVSTVYQWAQVVTTFGLSACVDYLNRGASYSHQRAAMYAQGDIDYKRSLLERAIKYHLSVEELQVIIYGKISTGGDEHANPPGQQPISLCKQQHSQVVGIDRVRGLVTLNIGDDVDRVGPYLNKNVILKIAIAPADAVEKLDPIPGGDDEDEDDPDGWNHDDDDEDDELDYVPRRGAAQPAEEDEEDPAFA
jgi:hypothetical protein